MARKKKSLDELDDELATLEAELAALETGADAAPREADDADDATPGDGASTGRRGRGRSKTDTTPEGDGDGPTPKRKLAFGRKKKHAVEEVEAPATPDEPVVDAGASAVEPPAAGDADEGAPEEPAKGRLGGLIGRGRKDHADADEAPPPAAPDDDEDVVTEAVPPPGPLHWQREGDGWLKTDDTPEPEPVAEAGAANLLGRFRSRRTDPEAVVIGAAPVESADATYGDEEAEPRKRRKAPLVWALILLLLLVVIVLAVLALQGGSSAPTAAFAVQGATDPASGGFLGVTGVRVAFDASATDGASSYRWDFGDGSAASETTAALTSHTYTRAGTFTVTLTAINADGESQATATVTILAKPVAVIAATKGNAPVSVATNPAFTGESITFSGTDSTVDAATTVSEYRWDWNGDGVVDDTGATVTHAFAEAGSHRVRLTVVDGHAHEASANLTVRVGVSISTDGVVGNGLPTSQPTTVDIAVPVQAGRNNAAPTTATFVLTWTQQAVAANSDVNITVLDAQGAIVARGVPDGSTQRIELTVNGVGAFAPGSWTARIAHADPTGVANQSVGTVDVPFELEIRILY